MSHLFQPFASGFEFSGWRFLRLLYEAVQDNDLLANHRAVKSPANSLLAPATKLKQALAHGSGVRQSQIGSVFLNETDQSQEVGVNAHWPFGNLTMNTFVKEVDRPAHQGNVSGYANFSQTVSVFWGSSSQPACSSHPTKRNSTTRWSFKLGSADPKAQSGRPSLAKRQSDTTALAPSPARKYHYLN
jgi:hypothetical protein